MADREQALQGCQLLDAVCSKEARYLVNSPEPRVYCINRDILEFRLQGVS